MRKIAPLALSVFWGLALVACDDVDSGPAEEAVSVHVEAGWSEVVHGRIANSGFQLTELDDGRLRFTNPAHDLRAFSDERGVVVMQREHGEAEPAWSFHVQTVAVGRGVPAPVEVGPAVVGGCQDDRADVYGECLRRLERSLGDIGIAWWANGPDGLEQGWTFAEEVAGAGPLTIDVDFGIAEARVLEGGKSAELLHGGNRLLYSGVKAWDALGRSLDAQLTSRDDGLRLEVDVEGAEWPVVVDPLYGEPSWVTQSGQWGGTMGTSVAGLGDVNGDGFDDIAIGARYYDNGQMNEGRVFVFLGSSSGPSTTADWSFESDHENCLLGISVSAAGDVNNDGYADLIVGAPQCDQNEEDEGQAFAFYGGAGGLSDTPNWQAEANQVEALFGHSVAGAGDVNNDGYDDVIVGAPHYDNGEEDEGQAFVYFGGPSGLTFFAMWLGDSDSEGALYGDSVAGAGDLNDDSYDDIVIGAKRYSEGTSWRGRAYVYYGGPSGPATSPSWTDIGHGEFHEFGTAVAGAGDVNDDGIADLVIGAPGYDATATSNAEGRVYVYYGSASGLPANQNWLDTGEVRGGRLGSSLAAAGDVDGDGRDDLLVGAEQFRNGDPAEGAVFLYLGPIGSGPDWRADSNEANSRLGTSLAGAGDVNGDGYDDIIAGAPGSAAYIEGEGRAYVYYGGSGGPYGRGSWTIENIQVYEIARAGDVNGDGFDDVIMGNTQCDNGQVTEGCAYLYKGSATGLETTASWSAESDQTNALFGDSVAAAGDVNGDGYDDVIIGAPQAGSGSGRPGRAFMYFGTSSGLMTFPVWTTEGTTPGDDLGRYVAGAGDVNGDGFADVIVGVDDVVVTSGEKGEVRLYLGGLAGPQSVPDWTLESTAAHTFVRSAYAAGDVNSDGFDDVVVPNSLDSSVVNRGGSVALYLGEATGLPSTPSQSVGSDVGEANFGWRLAAAGDVDGDGFDDLAISAQEAGEGLADEGVVYVHHGTASGLEATPRWMVQSHAAEVTMGSRLDGAGDVDGDGFDDLVLIGGHQLLGVQLYHGSASGLEPVARWQAPWAWGIGRNVIGVGDANGDGYDDLLLHGNDSIWMRYGSSTGLADTSSNRPPRITTTAPGTVSEGNTVTYDADAVDDDGPSEIWSVQHDDTCGGTIDGDGVYEFVPLAPMTECVLAIQVCDAGMPLLCDYASKVVDFVVINDPPVFVTTAPTSATEDTLYAYDADATDPDGPGETWTVGSSDTCGGATTSEGVYTFTPAGPTPPADCVVHLRVCDGGSPDECADQQSTVTIEAVNDAPVITSSAPTTATEEIEYVYEVTVEDDGPSTDWQVAGSDTCGGAVDSLGVYSFTPAGPVPEASCVLHVELCDLGIPSECVEETATVTIEAVNDAPVISTSGPVVATEGQQYSYDADATDFDSDIAGWSIGAFDTCGGTINIDGLYTFTQPGPTTPADCEVHVEVCDDGSPAACAEQQWTVSIMPVNDAPTASDDDYSFEVGVEVSVDAEDGVLANDSDPEGDVLSAVVVAEPTSGVLDLQSDGSFTYAPNDSTVESDSFTYEASDGALSSGEATVTIELTAEAVDTGDVPSDTGDTGDTDDTDDTDDTQDPGCGCSIGGPFGGSWMLLLGLMVALRRRGCGTDLSARLPAAHP